MPQRIIKHGIVPTIIALILCIITIVIQDDIHSHGNQSGELDTIMTCATIIRNLSASQDIQVLSPQLQHSIEIITNQHSDDSYVKSPERYNAGGISDTLRTVKEVKEVLLKETIDLTNPNNVSK